MYYSAVVELAVHIHNRVMEVKLSLFFMVIFYSKHTSDIVHFLEFSSNNFPNQYLFPSPDVRKER